MPKPMQKPRKRINKPRECAYCKNNATPDYKDPKTMDRFISERGKIVGRMYSGLCRKHQVSLTTEVKRARHVALLPFIVRPS